MILKKCNIFLYCCVFTAFLSIFFTSHTMEQNDTQKIIMYEKKSPSYFIFKELYLVDFADINKYFDLVLIMLGTFTIPKEIIGKILAITIGKEQAINVTKQPVERTFKSFVFNRSKYDNFPF